MPFNLLLLPLLAGYYFLHRFYLTKYRAQTFSGYRIILESALAGAGFLLLARMVTRLLALAPDSIVVEALRLSLKSVAPFPFSGTAILSVVLSILLVHGLNRFGDRGVAALRAYRKYGGELLALLLRVQAGDQRGPFPLMVTLKNRKVYVGWVLGAPTPVHEQQFLKLLPSLSGYRNNDDLSVHWTVAYADVYRRIQSGEFGTPWDPEDFAITVPLSEILAATRFVEEIPLEAFAVQSPVSSTPAAVVPSKGEAPSTEEAGDS